MVLAGVVTAIVGFASTFALVLAGLRAVGADQRQSASGLLALCVLMGLLSIGLGLRYRMPISIAWSTPGAALLISAGHQHGGYRAALGAFAVAGLLIVLAGLWRSLGRWLAAIPVSLANAMLAGVLLPVCLAPVRAVDHLPALALPTVLAWALLARVARRWAVPGALATAAVAVLIDHPASAHVGHQLLPVASLSLPGLNLSALVGVALPLFVVTMASQNVPGMSVLAVYGYRPPLRPILLSTGIATAIGAPLGAHAVNLAAITAAMVAGPDAHPHPDRRWLAAVCAGATYVVLGLSAGVVTALLAASPPLLVEAVAGLALLGALGAALSAATQDGARREPAIVTFVVSASGLTVVGISAPFWGLLAGLALTLLARGRRDP